MLFDQGDRFPFFIDDSGAESRRNQAGVSQWARIPLSFPTKCERSRLPCRSRAEGVDRIGIAFNKLEKNLQFPDTLTAYWSFLAPASLWM
jgi:hypothetical protein